MKLRFSESEISYWANRYTERQREKDRIREQHLIDLRCDVLVRGYLTKQELHTIARWKSPRRAALTLENTDDFIKEIAERAFIIPRQLDEIANVDSVARYRTADRIRNPTPLR